MTYSSQGLLPPQHTEHKDGYWIGWDYAHYEDYTFLWTGRAWTTEEILYEVKQVVNQLCEVSPIRKN